MMIYMDKNPQKSYKDYWKGPEAGRNASSHRIAIYMSFHWFSLLKRQLRIDDPDTVEVDVPGPYYKVNEWANVIMDAALSIVSIGSIIGVDEAMQAFQGRSKQKVTIKGKPTPTKLKIWVLAVAGYVLQWIWHRPGSQYGPVGVEGRRGPRKARNKVISSDGSSDGSSDKTPALNPTQAVVVAIIKRLPPYKYHIYLDNLFSSPDLFLALTQLGIGATGTCRTNCGLYRRLVELKEDDRKGRKMWPYNRIQSWATADNKVRIPIVIAIYIYSYD
jgi:hypothetical protein